MSVPLDRLYHYIQDVAEQIRGDHVIIYRFYPHGSKNIEDLKMLGDVGPYGKTLDPEIICYDQEPLNYDFYQCVDAKFNNEYKKIFNVELKIFKSLNLRYLGYSNMYDKCLLIHSEKNSVEVEKYKNDQFIPVYYWSHALIARDWFRYAKHISIKPEKEQQEFLIYNRAWGGTREYRIKFVELLQQNNLHNNCKTSFNSTDPEHNIHYTNHVFKNVLFKPKIILDTFATTSASSNSSADFDISDYANTKFEVVLETLFDDSRIQLTEKALRPIACGHPFILASTTGSLAYLRDYGFKTFDGIIDESYDLESDPVKRLQMIVVEMKKITQWTAEEQQHNWNKINQITAHNKQHFFSEMFENQIIDELKYNLKTALNELENTNTSKNFLEARKNYYKLIQTIDPVEDENRRKWRKENKEQLMQTLLKARKYYRRYLKSQRDS